MGQLGLPHHGAALFRSLALLPVAHPHQGWIAGFAYRNYEDYGIHDWGRAYFGENLGRLRRIKAAYDPEGVFSTWQQAILPPPPRTTPSTGGAGLFYADPVFDGAHDAEFVWNEEEQTWWMTYLQNRYNSPLTVRVCGR